MRNTQIALTLAAFHREHNQYPRSLDQLVPEFLDAVPDGVSTSQPLIYQLTGDAYLLYSVGPNGRDDQGQAYHDQPRGDDLPVRVPPPSD